MKIRVGFEMLYDFPQPTPMIMVLGDLRGSPGGPRQPALGHELVDIEAVAAVGRHSPRGGVRVLEQAALLESCQLAAHGRRTPGHVVELGDPLRGHGLIELDVRLHDLPEDEALAGSDLHASKGIQGPLSQLIGVARGCSLSRAALGRFDR